MDEIRKGRYIKMQKSPYSYIIFRIDGVYKKWIDLRRVGYTYTFFSEIKAVDCTHNRSMVEDMIGWGSLKLFDL